METTDQRTSQNRPTETRRWSFRLEGLAPDGQASVYVLNEGCLSEGGELEQFRREFQGTEGLSEKRVRELCLGRNALRFALIEKYGVDPGWVPVGDLGMPSLPRGMRASLTHSTIDGVPVAAVALTMDPEILGLDLEPIIAPDTALKLERRFAEHLPRDARGPEAMTELFTIYETIVKIASQLGHRKPVPSQIDLVEKTADTWTARLNAGRIEVVSGRFLAAFPSSQARLCYGWWDRSRSSAPTRTARA